MRTASNALLNNSKNGLFPAKKKRETHVFKFSTTLRVSPTVQIRIITWPNCKQSRQPIRTLNTPFHGSRILRLKVLRDKSYFNIFREQLFQMRMAYASFIFRTPVRRRARMCGRMRCERQIANTAAKRKSKTKIPNKFRANHRDKLIKMSA